MEIIIRNNVPKGEIKSYGVLAYVDVKTRNSILALPFGEKNYYIEKIQKELSKRDKERNSALIAGINSLT